MSTTALHLFQLAKRLPVEDQRLICAALSRNPAVAGRVMRLQFTKTPDGSRLQPDGIANDDPFFKIIDDIEEARHQTPARPTPDLR